MPSKSKKRKCDNAYDSHQEADDEDDVDDLTKRPGKSFVQKMEEAEHDTDNFFIWGGLKSSELTKAGGFWISSSSDWKAHVSIDAHADK